MSDVFEQAIPKTATYTRNILKSSFLWMTVALSITGVVSLYVASSDTVLSLLFSSRWSFYAVVGAEFALVWFLSSRIFTLSPGVATGLFALYSVMNGLTIAPIYLIYTEGSIAFVFFIAAGMFACMAAFGALTSYDLTKVGSFLTMALIGIVIASVANIFLRSDALGWISSFVGVFVFVGLTAWDTQKIKKLSAQMGNSVDDSQFRKMSILCALSIYLDFINLFLMLLRLFGRKR